LDGFDGLPGVDTDGGGGSELRGQALGGAGAVATGNEGGEFGDCGGRVVLCGDWGGISIEA